MKTNSVLLILATLVIALVNGCSKPEETAPPAAKSETPPAKMNEAVQQQAADMKQSADAVAAKAQDQATAGQSNAQKAVADALPPTPSDSTQVQGLIDKASQLIADKKWEDALKVLTDVSALKLTPDQHKLVDSLKQQAEKLAQDSGTKAATDAASKAAGDLLHKK